MVLNFNLPWVILLSTRLCADRTAPVRDLPCRYGARSLHRVVKKHSVRFTKVLGFQRWPFEYLRGSHNLSQANAVCPPSPCLSVSAHQWLFDIARSCNTRNHKLLNNCYNEYSSAYRTAAHIRGVGEITTSGVLPSADIS